jgi:mannose-6-phosphate isomerase-like protein (cupin superfamily)
VSFPPVDHDQLPIPLTWPDSRPLRPMEALSQPPGQPGKAYKLGSLCGEIIYIPCSKSATRLLVTGKESEGAFAVVSSGGSGGYPIGFHYHRQAHDVFLCIKGRMNVWAGDVCRTMEPGDFASVPPVGLWNSLLLSVVAPAR